ncbi:MAG TPA: hypothetical protein VF556_07670 [Pyrinomonadaceae bacterium]|jgi:hypothetical protein
MKSKNNEINKFNSPAIAVSERLMWREAKKQVSNFAHIKVALAGKEDVAVCRMCGAEIVLPVPGRNRQSLVLETARKHFYKHKLDQI